MDEKKKKGRPKKKEPEVSSVENEQSKTINMSSEQVREEKITLSQVQERWQRVFSAYANSDFKTIAANWNGAWSQLNNPFLQNARIKQINSPAKKLDQEAVQDALSNPENSEKPLMQLSMWLYYTNYVYNLLIKLNRDTAKYNWYYLPQYVKEADLKKDDFKKEAEMVDKAIKSFEPNLTWKTVTTQVSLEGKSSYLTRLSYDKDSVDFWSLQKLNTDMIKMTGFGSRQKFIASFNMMIFLQPAYNVDQYPQFIRDTWAEMLEGGIIIEDKKGNKKVNPRAKLPRGGILESKGDAYFYWVQLPQDLCYTFYSDGAHPNMLPDAIGLFNDLNELDDYRWLQANLLSKGVTSILTAEVPLVREPAAGKDSTAISADTVMGFSDLFNSSVSSNIMSFFAPFKEFQLHTLENQPENMDIIYDRTRDLIATSGNSALMSITDKPSIASVKAAQYIQESRVDYMVRQYESYMNYIINNTLGLKYKWRIYLWGGIFTHNEETKQLKELVFSGVEGMFPKLLSAMGMSVLDYSTSTSWMKELNIKVEKVLAQENVEESNRLALKTATNKISAKTTTTTSEEKVTSKDNVGRPKLDEDEITNDSTATSVDNGTNVSDIKEFSVAKCAICGKELDYGEEGICDECLEEKYDERIREIMGVTGEQDKEVKE